ncbi:MAG TPA: HYR domain-containing protein, partial [Pyrinomonadaceae bacterium]
GKWRIYISSAADNSLRTETTFTVHDPAKAFVDLSILQVNSTSESEVTAGSSSVFEIYVNNIGPNAATSVVITDTMPANVTFTSAVVDAGGAAFTCGTPSAGVFTCTLASFPADGTAHISFNYSVDSGTAAGTVLENVAAITSSATPCSPDATCELVADDNTSTGTAVVPAETGSPTCTLDCPNNITVIANTSENSIAGAFVTFAAAQPQGSCGAVSNSPASGSFFPVGSNTITSTSDSGDTCTFVVTVLPPDTAPPTISCPTDKTVSAPSGQSEATVSVGTPTTNPSTGVTVVGSRSDGLLLTDPYPLGLTLITWTVTDSTQQSSTCTQRVIVNSSDCANDTENPTITAPPDATANTGSGSTSCGVALSPSDDELGQPDASDNCSVIVTNNIPAGGFFPVGTTVVTYTATDGAGHTATDTQTVVVNDNTPPEIAAPADASYTCPSEVPAGNPSQAHGTNPNLPNGGPVFDNCGGVTVTVSDSSTGAGSAASPKIISRTFTATDSHGNSASAVQTITVIDPTPPTITSIPANATYQCASDVPAGNPSQATATDNCAAPTITVADTNNGGAGSPASPLVITRTFTATDAAGNTDSEAQTITVIDNTPPTITLNGANPQYVECHTSYPELGATANDNCTASFAATPSGTVDANTVGTYTITYNATDAAGNAATPVTRTVIVQDTIAPTITLNSYAPSMWPPNHKYTTFQLAQFVTGASDSCDTGLNLNDVVIEKVTSDEIENGNGDGNTTNDIVIAANCKSVQLRSEREGSGNGRVYTITFKVSDGFNTTRVTAKVVVPHNPGETPVDSGVHYTVNGTCP